jgi:hypothetical protein
MKTIKLFILIAIILGALANRVSKTERKRKMKLKSKMKFQRKTSIADWSINDNPTYKVFMYVDSKSDYTTCSFKCDSVYPSDKVAIDNRKGLTLTCTQTVGKFTTVATLKSGNIYQIDYKDCSSFSSNTSNSFWGLKGKTLNTYYKGVSVSLMFEYGTFGDYIESADLVIMTTHANNLRTERVNSVRLLKETCKDLASELNSKNENVSNLSKPVTSLDDAIKQAESEVLILKSQKVTSETTVGSLSDLIISINKQITETQNLLDIAELAETTALTNSHLKQAEIEEYTKSKNGSETERQAQLSVAQEKLKTTKGNFDTCTDNILDTCDSCETQVNLAKIAFSATPFNSIPVIANINAIYTSGN